MTTYSLDELITPISAEEWRASIYEMVAAAGTPTTSWQPWAPTRVVIYVLSLCLAALSVLVARVAAGGYLGLASRPWLVLLAKHRFGVDDIQSKTFAATTVRLVNTGTGVYNPGPNEWLFENPATGAQYRNSAAFSLGIGGTVDVPVTCTEQGAIGTSAVGAVSKIVTTANGVTCTNTTTALGLEDATIEEIVALCLARRDSRSTNGPKGAYDYDARTAKRVDGTPIGVNRVRVLAPGDGSVSVYVATPTGEVSGDQENTATDLGRIRLAIAEGAETQGVQPNVYSATSVPLAVVYELWCYSDIDVTTFPGTTLVDRIQARVFQRLGEFAAKAPIGGYDADSSNRIFSDALATVIAQVAPQIYRVKITLPAESLAVGVGQFPELVSCVGTVHIEQRKVLA